MGKKLIVGAQTNAGRAAAAIAGVMREDPSAAASHAGASVQAMGAGAVHQAMIAGALAQNYLNNDGKGVKFNVIPRFEEVESGETGKRNRQLVLQMVRAKK